MKSQDDLKVHPAADIFPMLSDEELQALAADIKANGLIHPIVLDAEEQILDGRNRLAACKLAGVEPRFEKLNGHAPLTYIISANLARRHLTPSQRAAIGAEMLPLFEKEAADRQKALASSRPSKHLPEKVPEGEKGESREKVGQAVGVNPRYVSDAKKLKEQAPELFAQLKTGSVRLRDAKRQALHAAREAANRAALESWKPGASCNCRPGWTRWGLEAGACEHVLPLDWILPESYSSKEIFATVNTAQKNVFRLCGQWRCRNRVEPGSKYCSQHLSNGQPRQADDLPALAPRAAQRGRGRVSGSSGPGAAGGAP